MIRQPGRVVASFYIGLSRNAVGGGGRLHVDHGKLWAEPGKGARALALRTDEIKHHRSDVFVVHRRLLPPFLSCAIPLTDERGYVEGVASFPIWTRSSIVEALREHGFEVLESNQWLSLPNPPHRIKATG